MQRANRSATRRRFSTSRSASTPPSDDNSPPSNLATTDLPATGDRPGSGSVGSFMSLRDPVLTSKNKHAAAQAFPGQAPWLKTAAPVVADRAEPWAGALESSHCPVRRGCRPAHGDGKGWLGDRES